MKQKKNRFTLVEILMVTGMICLIAALIVVAYNGVYRSWSTRNTIAAMKAAHLALDKYMLENGGYPRQVWSSTESGQLRFNVNSSDRAIAQLALNLEQDCAPYSYRNGTYVVIFDDFGPKPPNTPNAIHYVFPYGNSFALMSKGKNGQWGGDDDIVYFPVGTKSEIITEHFHGGAASTGLKPGFYMGNVDSYGAVGSGVAGEKLEPLAH